MTLTLMLTLLPLRGSEMARLRFYQPSPEDSKKEKKQKNDNNNKKIKVLQKTVYATLWIQWIQKWDIIVPKVGKV